MGDYYDIDDILADQQRIPCHLTVDIPGLATNETRSNGGQLQADTTIELPLWMAESLAANDFVELQLPRPYGSRMQRILYASCRNVNFHALCPYFYKFGLKLSLALDEPQLNELLADVYRQRLELVLDAAQRSDAQNMVEFISQLDETEKQSK
ncbi:DNA replication protein [Dispira simplex]|nr:DNA replication protein [Dispira simplex]